MKGTVNSQVPSEAEEPMIGGQVKVKFGVRWAWKETQAKSSFYDVWALDGSERAQI